MNVSVVIPAFDAAAYLGQAIESVLAQTLVPSEVIVVDDGSEDRTAAIAESVGEPVTCVRQARAGAAAARNRGVQLAAGEQLAFLDADDLWLADKLSLQVVALCEAPEVDLVFGHTEHFHSPELTSSEKARIKRPSGRTPGICPGAMLIRREAFDRVGGFATRLGIGEFVDWYARAMDSGLRTLVLPEAVMYRRLHPANTASGTPGSHSDYVRVLRTVLDRRRGVAPPRR
jgi:glycosyltransferase involved in cell wall biosynthesis